MTKHLNMELFTIIGYINIFFALIEINIKLNTFTKPYLQIGIYQIPVL